MIRARLMVAYQFDKDDLGNAREENWGEYDFAALPSAGHSLRLIYNRIGESVIVRHVEHFPIQHPLPVSESPIPQRTSPALIIHADYSGL